MSRLGRRQGADLVARVTGGKPLPAEIVEQIVARTDGVPLFVEELTKTVLESGLLADAGDHYELSGPLPPLAIPTTLHDSLMARLDRLAPVKEVAQIGAVIGREFSHALLAAVRRPPGHGTRCCARAAGRIRAGVPPRHPARGDLQLQARAGPGRGLPVAAQVEAPAAACPDCRGARAAVPRHRENEAGAARPSLCRGRLGRESGFVLGEGRSSVRGASAMAEAVVQSRNGLDLLAAPARQCRTFAQGARAAKHPCRGSRRHGRERGTWGPGRHMAAPVRYASSSATRRPWSRSSAASAPTNRRAAISQPCVETALDLLRLGEQLSDTASELVGNRSMALCLYHLGQFIRLASISRGC